MNALTRERGARRVPTVWRVVGGAALVVAVICAMALLVEHDAAGEAPAADLSIRDLLFHYGYLAGFALIYIEESGLPLFIPGDGFLLYVGHRLPHELPVLAAAWLGFTLAVTAGASNLYLLSRRYGRSLLQHRLAAFLHLTPERLDRAERWFGAWGPWALIVGRHIFGLRVPLTVAAGILKLPYPVFAVSVAISSAAWAGIFLTLGSIYGNAVEHSIRSQPLIYAAVLAGVLILGAAFFSARYAAALWVTRRR